MSVDPDALVEQAVQAIAGQLGVELDADQVVELAARAIDNIGDLVSAKAWREARAAGDAAASTITTLEEAEASAKRPR